MLPLRLLATISHLAGQLRFDTASGILYGDIDGNGEADFEIQLAEVKTNLLILFCK